MFLEAKDMFNVTGGKGGRPLLNELQIGSLSVSGTFLADRRTLMNWIKRTPEAIGIIRAISRDIVTKISFKAIEQPIKTGRPTKNAAKDNEAKALNFAKVNFLKQQLRAEVIEMLALGEGFLWKGKSTRKERETALQETFKEFGMGAKEIEFKQFIDEDAGDKALVYVPSATMDIQIHKSGTKIAKFYQRVSSVLGGQTFPTGRFPGQEIASTNPQGPREWEPEEIIHHKFIEIDGKVHGYTPFQAGFPIIKTLGAIKDYHGHFFENGIIPDIINFEDLDANGPEYAKMHQELENWWNNKTREPLVTASKMTVQQINKWNKDMEFNLLAIYYTGVLAFSVGMPLEKIRAILGGIVKSSTGGSDIGTSDYLDNITDMQDDLEQLLNTQFFNTEFGVDICFERKGVRDEQAEAARDQQKLGVVTKMIQSDLINKENYIDLLEKNFPDIPRAWWNPNPQPIQQEGVGSFEKPTRGQGEDALSKRKKEEQKPQAKNKPPTGL